MCFQLRMNNIELFCYRVPKKTPLWNFSESSAEELGWFCIFCVRASWRWYLVSDSGGGQRRDLHFSPHGSHSSFLFPHWSNIPLMKPSGFFFITINCKIQYILFSLCPHFVEQSDSALSSSQYFTNTWHWRHPWVLGDKERATHFWSTEHFSCPSQCLQGLRARSLHQVVGGASEQSQGVPFS